MQVKSYIPYGWYISVGVPLAAITVILINEFVTHQINKLRPFLFLLLYLIILLGREIYQRYWLLKGYQAQRFPTEKKLFEVKKMWLYIPRKKFGRYVHGSMIITDCRMIFNYGQKEFWFRGISNPLLLPEFPTAEQIVSIEMITGQQPGLRIYTNKDSFRPSILFLHSPTKLYHLLTELNSTMNRY